MKLLLLFGVLAVGWIGFVLWQKNTEPQVTRNTPEDTTIEEPVASVSTEELVATETSYWQEPLENAKARVTKKPFGLIVTKENSPVQPERFSGYHTGTDFETLPGEEDREVSVHAICPGEIVQKRTASGYGGVLVERCIKDEETFEIIYGHVDIGSIKKQVGETLVAGEEIGVLGEGYSVETDGERRHLHLGIYTGSGVSILGYVQNSRGLSDWLDACTLVCR